MTLRDRTEGGGGGQESWGQECRDSSAGTGQLDGTAKTGQK